jgi:hypothetical protein
MRVTAITKSQHKLHLPTYFDQNLHITSKNQDKQKTVSNNASIVACVFVAAGTCLLSRCLATIG